MAGILRLDSTAVALAAGETYQSASFPLNAFNGIERFSAIVRSDRPFRVTLYQGNDETNWDHESVSTTEKIGGIYQCAFAVDRFGIYARWQIANLAGLLDGAMTFLRGQVNGFGQNITPHAGMLLVNRDETSNPTYMQWLDVDGCWCIQKTNNGEDRYARGKTDYVTAWGNRASIGYDYPDMTWSGV